jgi:hypothetical protein
MGINILTEFKVKRGREAIPPILRRRSNDGYTGRFNEMLEIPLTVRFFDDVRMD